MGKLKSYIPIVISILLSVVIIIIIGSFNGTNSNKNPKEIYERIKDKLYNSSCIWLWILWGLIYIVIRVLPIVIILAIIL